MYKQWWEEWKNTCSAHQLWNTVVWSTPSTKFPTTL
jgi:hypothetical protein